MTRRRPIVFLDIDGVLNDTRTSPAEQFSPWAADAERLSVQWFEPAMVARLNEITTRAGASIVVHSSWRRIFDIDQMRRIFERVGITAAVDALTEGGDRAGSIRAWLASAGHHVEPIPFVVLDDIDMRREDVIGAAQVVVCDGMTDEHVGEALALLLEAA